jgi:hypothetical protein
MNSASLGSKNLFTNSANSKELNFRNKTNDRTSVSSIEIRKLYPTGGCESLESISVKEEDNVAMAIAILGVGRVTDDVESEAKIRAEMILDANYGHTEDGVLKQAIIALRSILIAREMEAAAATKDLDDAYALYKLAYPKTTTEFESFKVLSMKDHWLSVLRRMRKDPTVLGTL